jgi:hypothetical protein
MKASDKKDGVWLGGVLGKGMKKLDFCEMG